ncbi:MAG TPA: methyltransferase [Roseiflexaceae bacterium]|nr:methyltransferase [Roseiflexaceae bacterium]
MTDWSEDIYFKKRLHYALHRQQFLFDTGELLFSTDEIDQGTQLLLRHVIDATPDAHAVLDIGCGYGVIGVVLARLHPEARVVLCDKDLLAVRYTRHNIALNGAANAEVFASIGVGGVPQQPYDLILSNIPGHIGDRAILADFVLGPLALLAPGGSYWVVVVTPLAALLERIRDEHQIPVEEIARRKAHVVYRIRKM